MFATLLVALQDVIASSSVSPIIRRSISIALLVIGWQAFDGEFEDAKVGLQ
jgi:hypothetical protein